MKKLIEFIKNKKKMLTYLFLKLLTMGLGMITNVLIVRKISVENFGYFSVAGMLLGLITTFGFSWSSSTILYYGSKEKDENGTMNKTFWARNIIIFFSLVVVSILFILFRDIINQYIGVRVSYLLLFWLYANVIEDYLSQYFLAIKKQTYSVLLSIISKAICLALILVLPLSVETLIKINIISRMVTILFVFGIDKNDIKNFEFNKEWFIEILRFSLWQLFGFSGLYLINFGDTIVIKHFMDIENVGIYNAAYKIFNIIAGFSFIISNFYVSSVSSYFSNNDYKGIKKIYYEDRIVIFVLSMLLHLLVIIFSKNIILILYNESYIEASNVLKILVFGSIFRYLAVFYTLYYNINGKYKTLQNLNIVRAILNFGLDIIMIKIFGILGPAIATSISIIATFIFSFWYCEKNITKYAKPIKI